MEYTNIINRLTETQHRLLGDLPAVLRPIFNNIKLQDERGAFILGARGVGKSTFLLNQIQQTKRKALYISLDSLLLADIKLYDFAAFCVAQGYEILVLDELHFAQNWSQNLKGIYDSFPKLQIWASDSSSLVLRKGVADLSRRFPARKIPYVSFREYLFLKHKFTFEKFNPFELKSQDFLQVTQQINVLPIFQEYLREGFRPLFLEPGFYQEKIAGIVDKMIYADIPFFVPAIQDNYLRMMKAVMAYLASANIPTINIESLSKEWAIGKEKLYNLLSVMEHSGLINIIRFQKDFKSLSKGAKIFLSDPSFYYLFNGAIGNVREAFVSTMFRDSGQQIYACKDETIADFIVGKMRLEIGGKNKMLKKADYVVKDDIDLPGATTVPLWSLGMMY